MDSVKWTSMGLCASIAASVLSVVAIDFSPLHHYISSWYFVSDSNKILALLVGVFAVLTFKNLKIGYSPLINKIASTTFGVFLIHTASDGMRFWLWKKVFPMTSFFQCSTVKMISAFIAIPVVIFIVCAIIDLMRQKWIEKPILKLFRH